MWRIYMSKLTKAFYKDLPPYTQLIEEPVVVDNHKMVTQLIDKINKYNSRGKDEFI